MTNKYDANPSRLKGITDITEYIKNINDRLTTKESSFQIGHTSIEDGDLLVRNGDIRVGETDGTTVLRLLHGAIPEIRMYPLGSTDTHQIAIFGFDAGSAPSLDQALQLGIEKLAGFVQDGGKIILSRNLAVMAHQPDGGAESFIWLNVDGSGSPEAIRIRGRFRDALQYDDRQAIYPGSDNVTAGVSTWTHTYPSTFAGNMLPIATVNYNGSTTQWNLDSYTSSSFTVRFSVSAGGKDLLFWVIRCD